MAPYLLFLPPAKKARKNIYGQEIEGGSIESFYDTITFIVFKNKISQSLHFTISYFIGIKIP